MNDKDIEIFLKYIEESTRKDFEGFEYWYNLFFESV